MSVKTPPPEEAAPALRADARRNRERILQSAREVFAEAGPEAQMDDIARRAGVGVGTVYRHFPTKDVLVTELVRQKFVLFGERMREALEGDEDAFTALTEVMRRNAETAATDAGMQFALGAAGDEIWDQVRAEQEQLVGLTDQLIARAKHDGTIRPDIRGLDIAMLMCGVCSGMAVGVRGFDWRRHLQLAIDAISA